MLYNYSSTALVKIDLRGTVSYLVLGFCSDTFCKSGHCISTVLTVLPLVDSLVLLVVEHNGDGVIICFFVHWQIARGGFTVDKKRTASLGLGYSPFTFTADLNHCQYLPPSIHTVTFYDKRNSARVGTV